MIRALTRSASVMLLSVIIAAVVLVTAFLASTSIVIAGCYLALWPPKQRSSSLKLVTALLDRTREKHGN